MDINSLRQRANQLKPIVRIGRNGLTKTVIDELKKHLKKRGLIKIKLLRSFIEENDKKGSIENILKATDSILISQKGSSVVIYKKNC